MVTLVGVVVPLIPGLVPLIPGPVAQIPGPVTPVGSMVSVVGRLVALIPGPVTLIPSLIPLVAGVVALIPGLIPLVAGSVTSFCDGGLDQVWLGFTGADTPTTDFIRFCMMAVFNSTSRRFQESWSPSKVDVPEVRDGARPTACK